MDHGEGCGQRVQVTPAQAQHVRSACPACSRRCVLKTRDLRTQQGRLDLGVPGLSEGAAHTSGLASKDGAAQEREHITLQLTSALDIEN